METFWDFYISCFSFFLLDCPFLVHPSIILWLILKIKRNFFLKFFYIFFALNELFSWDNKWFGKENRNEIKWLNKFRWVFNKSRPTSCSTYIYENLQIRVSYIKKILKKICKFFFIFVYFQIINVVFFRHVFLKFEHPC